MLVGNDHIKERCEHRRRDHNQMRGGSRDHVSRRNAKKRRRASSRSSKIPRPFVFSSMTQKYRTCKYATDDLYHCNDDIGVHMHGACGGSEAISSLSGCSPLSAFRGFCSPSHSLSRGGTGTWLICIACMFERTAGLLRNSTKN